eukprot:563671-Hanusia_phi.AAC.2
MGGRDRDARSAEEAAYASMGGNDLDASLAEVKVSASTGGNDLDARHAGEGAYVNMGGNDPNVRSAEERRYASMGGADRIARSAEEGAYASTGGSDSCAKSVGGQGYASTDGNDLDARHVGEEAYASTGGYDTYARLARARVSASTAVDDVCARSVEESTVRNAKYEGYCHWCFVHEFPDKPVAREYRTKERLVFDCIVQKFPNITWVNDKRVYGACSKRRPDVFADLGTHVLIVEVDEDQHRPMAVIRFNPDTYIKKDGTKVISPWGQGKIRKKHEKQWQERLEVLYKHVEQFIQKVPDNELVPMVRLFYDEYE